MTGSFINEDDSKKVLASLAVSVARSLSISNSLVTVVKAPGGNLSQLSSNDAKSSTTAVDAMRPTRRLQGTELRCLVAVEHVNRGHIALLFSPVWNSSLTKLLIQELITRNVDLDSILIVVEQDQISNSDSKVDDSITEIRAGTGESAFDDSVKSVLTQPDFIDQDDADTQQHQSEIPFTANVVSPKGAVGISMGLFMAVVIPLSIAVLSCSVITLRKGSYCPRRSLVAHFHEDAESDDDASSPNPLHQDMFPVPLHRGVGTLRNFGGMDVSPPVAPAVPRTWSAQESIEVVEERLRVGMQSLPSPCDVDLRAFAQPVVLDVHVSRDADSANPGSARTMQGMPRSFEECASGSPRERSQRRPDSSIGSGDLSASLAIVSFPTLPHLHPPLSVMDSVCGVNYLSPSAAFVEWPQQPPASPPRLPTPGPMPPPLVAARGALSENILRSQTGSLLVQLPPQVPPLMPTPKTEQLVSTWVTTSASELQLDDYQPRQTLNAVEWDRTLTSANEDICTEAEESGVQQHTAVEALDDDDDDGDDESEQEGEDDVWFVCAEDL